jgi:hypothetical protein
MIISPYHDSEELIRKSDSSGMVSSVKLSVVGEGRSQINSVKTKDFLDLDLSNSKSNSCRMKIHLEYFPLST